MNEQQNDSMVLPVIHLREIQNSRGDVCLIESSGVQGWKLEIHGRRKTGSISRSTGTKRLESPEELRIQLTQFLENNYSDFEEIEEIKQRSGMRVFPMILVSYFFGALGIAFFSFLIAFFMSLLFDIELVGVQSKVNPEGKKIGTETVEQDAALKSDPRAW